MTILYEEDLLPGDSKNRTVAQVAAENPGALIKFQENSGRYCISDEVIDNLEKYRNLNAKARKIRATGHGAVS
jgi:hypothetical protein